MASAFVVPRFRLKIFIALLVSSVFYFGIICIRIFLMDKQQADWTLFIKLPLIMFIFVAAMLLELIYFRRYMTKYIENTKYFVFLILVQSMHFAMCLLLEKISLFAIPMTFAVTMIAIFCDAKVAVISAFISAFINFGAFELFALFEGLGVGLRLSYLAVSIICGTLMSFYMTNNTRRLQYIGISFAINLLLVPIVFGFDFLINSNLETALKELPYMAAGILGSVILPFIFQPIFESSLNLLSNYRLIELTDHNHPLLAKMAEETPGTFNHCQTVASLAETCARAIDENVYMARACGYYHDVGKLKAPGFYKENQASSYNPHDELTPEVSTSILLKHTTDGYSICKSYRIPEEIAKSAIEHHGTLPAYYFYAKALEYADGRLLDIEKFSYSGPKPTSVISAVVMICDACEATVRTMDKRAGDSIDKAVKSIIDSRQEAGQFDDCDITSNQLSLIRSSIVNAFCGLYHERIKYKAIKKRK